MAALWIHAPRSYCYGGRGWGTRIRTLTEQYAEYPYPVTVQYFERVRLEYHGDPADPLYGQSNAVYGGMTLGRLGAAVYAGNQP